WAGRQENIRPPKKCFFLDSFYRTNQELELTVDISAARFIILLYRNTMTEGEPFRLSMNRILEKYYIWMSD
ncbi:MAG: hypothetical protein WBV87_17980, partial [Candidatus Acidiferrales bacterium]